MFEWTDVCKELGNERGYNLLSEIIKGKECWKTFGSIYNRLIINYFLIIYLLLNCVCY